MWLSLPVGIQQRFPLHRAQLCKSYPICCIGDASISHMVQTGLATVGRSSIEKTPELYPKSWETTVLSVGTITFRADGI